MNTTQSEKLFNKAQELIPGGVNSPVRAFKSVKGNPLFIESARGVYMYDADGNSFIDLINSWGPMVLGHAHEAVEQKVIEAVKKSLSFGTPARQEVEIAELICAMVPSVEKVRMVNSGTEACMSAVRAARGYTGRQKIIKFEGCYHGHADQFLIAAGSGAATMGSPNSGGVTEGAARDTLLARFNDAESVRKLVENNRGEIAALIIEPVAGNMGLIPGDKEFLQYLRKVCDEEGIVLIFDEVMSGFRLDKGGAQELLHIYPDMTTLGKIIGGGMPVGAFGGKKEIMDCLSPLGNVYQSGTLSGNPVAMAAGCATLHYLNDHVTVYSHLNDITSRIVKGIKQNIESLNLNYTINHIGSMWSLFFTEQEVKDFDSAKSADLNAFAAYFHAMLNQGIYLAPSQFESLFVSNAVTTDMVDKIVEANKKALEEINIKHSMAG